MPNLVVVGAQWGDEGKGKIVDLCTEQADLVVRYSGGNNAGHTLVGQANQLVLHLIPSGVLHPDKLFLLADGLVIDPWALLEEIDGIAALGIHLADRRLLISPRAHLVMPYHRVLDELRERGTAALGTTRRGIGPAYEDKAARRGIRVGDLLSPDRLRRRLTVALDEANARIRAGAGSALRFDDIWSQLTIVRQRLSDHIQDTSLVIHEAAARGESILFEGAQGTLLDLDHGTYPFVTSSTTVAGGACGGAGVGPRLLHAIVGVAKAYVTRVGAGPFPSEMDALQAETLREKGKEYGATTGRARRCGWLDLPALRYAARVSGFTQLALTKLDVLAGIHPLCVCTAYQIGSQRVDHFPFDVEELEQAKPVLNELAGFDADITQANNFADLPAGAREVIEMLEKQVGIEVSIVSVGPKREQTLVRRSPWSCQQRE